MTTKKPAPKKMGRPTKLNATLQQKIVRYIKNGNYVETAASAAGVNKSTLYDWLKRGANEKSGIYYDFSNAIEKALAESEINDLALITRAAKAGAWQAAAWRLERKHAHWNKKDKIELESQHTEKEEIVMEQKLTADPEAKELLRQLFRKRMDMEREGK